MYFTNHRMFKNKFMGEWAEFAIQQAKLVFSLYVNGDESSGLFPYVVLGDVVRLLGQVVMFSYEPVGHRAAGHEDRRDRFVK